jgi:hypothetical protein
VSQYEPQGREPSGWAIGGITFAAVMMMTIGIFQIIAGIAAIIEDDFYVVGSEYAFNLDVSGWGWIHLILGLLLVFAGWSLFAGKTWAGIFAIVLAVLAAIANFFYIPYYPFWSLLVIALCVWVIWSLTRGGGSREV